MEAVARALPRVAAKGERASGLPAATHEDKFRRMTLCRLPMIASKTALCLSPIF